MGNKQINRFILREAKESIWAHTQIDYSWCLNLLSHLSGHLGMRKLRVVETTLTPWLPDCKGEVASDNVFSVHTAVHLLSGHQPQEPWTMSALA